MSDSDITTGWFLVVTVDEVLDNFIRRSGLPPSVRTRNPDGIKHGSFVRLAVRCSCSADYDHEGRFIPCLGWKLIKPEPMRKHQVEIVTRYPTDQDNYATVVGERSSIGDDAAQD